jgi:predicted ATP-dependent endonuclease of OLD family
MFVNEDRIPREIAWLGHGFQVWLQLLTFLVKSGHKETLVLDEPDIFLHSDLQKRLVDVCRQLSSQTIVATHAVDIIEDVDPEDIVLVDKHINETVVLSTMNDVQKCINELGSYQNVRLAHLLRGRTCLFVEGKDFKLLRSLARKLERPGFAGEDGFGVVQIEGFSNWERLKHVDWFSRNALGEPMKYYAILDRDYYPPNFVEDVERTLRSKGVVPHVWTRKELENYLVDYDALYRVFVRRLSARDTRDNATPTFKSFCASLDSIAHTLRDDVFGQIAAKRLAHPESRSRDQSTTASLTFAQFTRDWGDRRYRTQVIPGKEFFARVNRRLGDRYKVSISAGALIQSLRPQDVDPEIASVIDEFMNLVRS